MLGGIVGLGMVALAASVKKLPRRYYFAIRKQRELIKRARNTSDAQLAGYLLGLSVSWGLLAQDIYEYEIELARQRAQG